MAFTMLFTSAYIFSCRVSLNSSQVGGGLDYCANKQKDPFSRDMINFLLVLQCKLAYLLAFRLRNITD